MKKINRRFYYAIKRKFSTKTQDCCILRCSEQFRTGILTDKNEILHRIEQVQKSGGIDKHRNDPVLNDIIDITDGEKLGAEAVRVIAWIDTDTGKGYQREYSIVPDSEGGDENTYTYSGTLKACGELSEETTYTSINNWQGAEVST